MIYRIQRKTKKHRTRVINKRFYSKLCFILNSLFKKFSTALLSKRGFYRRKEFLRKNSTRCSLDFQRTTNNFVIFSAIDIISYTLIVLSFRHNIRLFIGFIRILYRCIFMYIFLLHLSHSLFLFNYISYFLQ